MEIWRPEIEDLRYQVERNRMDREEYGIRVRAMISEWAPLIEKALEETGVHVAAMHPKWSALLRDRKAFATNLAAEQRYCKAKNIPGASPMRYLVPRVEYRRARPDDIIGARVVLDAHGIPTDEWILTLGSPVVMKGTVDGREEWLRVTNDPDDTRLGHPDKLGVVIGVEAILDNSYKVGRGGVTIRVRVEPHRKRKAKDAAPQE